MKQLTIVRHAKAASGGNYTDFDRPLTERGLSDAATLGDWLSRQSFRCDSVHVSAAKRTQESFRQLQTRWSDFGDHAVHDGLYLASPGDLLSFLQAMPEAQQSVMLLGHNPGLHLLGLTLVPLTESADYEALELSFPTSSCLMLSCEIEHWHELAPGCAQMQSAWRPERAL